MKYAHRNGDFCEPWEDHADAVYKNLLELGVEENTAYVLGYGHDLGKLTKEWQKYLFIDNRTERKENFVEHKAHGAYLLYNNLPNKTLARVVYAHHGRGNETGINCVAKTNVELEQKIKFFACGNCQSKRTTEDNLEGSGEVVERLKNRIKHLPDELKNAPAKKYAACDDFRLLLAKLTYADWTASGEWNSTKKHKPLYSDNSKNFKQYLTMIEKKYKEFEGKAKSKVDEVRNDIREVCEKAAEVEPNKVYKMSIPTGGGKTLASINWAIRHAIRYNKRRIVVVIPFTRIIKQTSKIYRDIFGDNNILESHSQAELKYNENDTAVDNSNRFFWNKDIVITTDVAFFSSWYTTNSRKLLRTLYLQDSVIIFDECQWIPVGHLLPCTQYMKVLTEKLNSTILLSTATMPAYEHADDNGSVSKVDALPLLPLEKERYYYEQLRRVDCRWLGIRANNDVLNHYQVNHDGESALFIVNSTSHCQELYSLLEQFYSSDNVFHLSKRMTQTHIDKTLKEVSERLSKGMFTILVSTILIEAGVDISFPVVYRSQCGLDSLAQSAGRCNRNGELKGLGKCYLYRRDDEEGETELKTPFFRFSYLAYDCLRDADVYNLAEEPNQNTSIDIYDAEKMQNYFRKFFLENGVRDRQKLLGGSMTMPYKDALSDIELIPNADTNSVIIMDKDNRKFVERLIRRDTSTKKDDNIMLTKRERKIIKRHSVEIFMSKEKHDNMQRSATKIHHLDGVWVIDVENTGTPIHYDNKMGLVFGFNVKDFVF